MSAPDKLKTQEHKLIEAIAGWAGQNYIGDDCAVLPGQNLVTSDTLVEGTHFLLDLTSPADLGWKSVAVNLSDIAAMAGRPRQLLVNLTLPPGFSQVKLRELFGGMVECARTYRTSIVGGDLTRGPVLAITLAALGEVHESGCLRRSQAKPGDIVAVTGDFGASAAGLWLLKQQVPGYQHCKQAHLRPQPRLHESWELVRRTGSSGALMDASDGLADALVQICCRSGRGMEIDLQAVPVHGQTIQAAALAGIKATDWVLYGGEDYELVACIPAKVWGAWAGDNPFCAIGKVIAADSLTVTAGDGRLQEIDLSQAFQHI